MKGTIVAQHGSIRGTIKPTASIIGTLKASGVIIGQVCIHKPIITPGGAEVYEGSYYVTPKTTEQVMPTADRYMVNDMTVRKIPYYEASNSSGGSTVYIGTEVI